MLPNSNCKLPNIEVAELAVWPCDDTKACCVLQANSCHLKSERAWAIYLTPRLRKQKCAARPGRRPRCGGWQKSMWNRALTWMHPTCADRWEKTWPIKVKLGGPLKDCPSTRMSICKFSNYTEWWWCVEVKTVHSMMSRNVPKVAHSMFQ